MADGGDRSIYGGDYRINSLAVIIGPYRNLSTLTAATLSLHPQIQVMNHGLERLLADPLANFIASPEQPTLHRFIETALSESSAGRRGTYGGSILLSHAFDSSTMRDMYEQRFGDSKIKEAPTCLVLKDSMRFQNAVAGSKKDISDIVTSLPKLFLLLPIRNPLDCAMSNLETGYIAHLGRPRDVSLEDAVGAVLTTIREGLELADKHPGRVMHFTENDAPPELLRRCATFLNVSTDERWLNDASRAFRIRSKSRDMADLKMMHRKARSILGRWPSTLAALGIE